MLAVTGGGTDQYLEIRQVENLVPAFAVLAEQFLHLLGLVHVVAHYTQEVQHLARVHLPVLLLVNPLKHLLKFIFFSSVYF